jgi:DNA helicase-2/ATP-dependent DNA helicase PcrA
VKQDYVDPLPPLASILEDLNGPQREAVRTTKGPVLLIAGPGAGKTLTLVRRTLHLITAQLADPSEIVLCTFTEKAALEIRDRLRSGAAAIGVDTDLTGLKTGTIHGICNEFVEQHPI